MIMTWQKLDELRTSNNGFTGEVIGVLKRHMGYLGPGWKNAVIGKEIPDDLFDYLKSIKAKYSRNHTSNITPATWAQIDYLMMFGISIDIAQELTIPEAETILNTLINAQKVVKAKDKLAKMNRDYEQKLLKLPI